MTDSWRRTPPYTQNYRTEIKSEDAGVSLIDFFCRRFFFFTRDQWLDYIAREAITVNRDKASPDDIIKVGDIIHSFRNDVQEPDVRDDYEVLYEENGVLVVNKPAPLPVHAAGRYYKNSLLYILQEKFPDKKFHTIHRLDLWTTGVLFLATDPKAAAIIHREMDKGQVEKMYGVLATGNFMQKEFIVDEPIGRLSGNRRGVGGHLDEAKPAVTRFTVIAQKDDVTLLKAEPITGRTNQIRVHIQAAGGHIVGDPLYGAGEAATDFMGLHCRSMRLKIAQGSEPTTFVAPWPDGFKKYFSVELENF